MEKQKGFLGTFIIASAIIWGAVIVTCALILKGDGFQKIALTLNGAAVVHLIIIWVPLAAQIKKLRNKE